jgi:hypothetical protein
MYNNGGTSNISNSSYPEESKKVTEKLRICMYLIFSLAFLRIFSLQFYGLFSDLVAAAIVYCTYTGKGRIMAMFCLINAFLGIVYSIAIGSIDLSKLNKPQVTKSPYDIYGNNAEGINLNGNLSSNNINNYQFPNGGLNGSSVPNKEIYGLANSNGKNNYGSNLKNNNYNNDQIGNNNNNYDNAVNQDLNNNNNVNLNAESSSFTFFYILCVTIYAVIIYAILTYFSYKAFEIYKLPFGEMPGDAENPSGGYYNGQNYGAVDTNRNAGYSSIGRNSTAAAPAANTNRNFVPFCGSGQRLEQ